MTRPHDPLYWGSNAVKLYSLHDDLNVDLGSLDFISSAVLDIIDHSVFLSDMWIEFIFYILTLSFSFCSVCLAVLTAGESASTTRGLRRGLNTICTHIVQRLCTLYTLLVYITDITALKVRKII